METGHPRISLLILFPSMSSPARWSFPRRGKSSGEVEGADPRSPGTRWRGGRRRGQVAAASEPHFPPASSSSLRRGLAHATPHSTLFISLFAEAASAALRPRGRGMPSRGHFQGEGRREDLEPERRRRGRPGGRAGAPSVGNVSKFQKNESHERPTSGGAQRPSTCRHGAHVRATWPGSQHMKFDLMTCEPGTVFPRVEKACQ